MSKQPLVSLGTGALTLALWLGLAPLGSFGQTATFGQPIPLPGQINEIVVDEARGLVYAANFSAGRIEVVSMATNQRIASFPSSPNSAALTAMAMSLNRQYLLTANVPVKFGVDQLSGLTLINLNDPSQRQHFPIAETPLAVAFGANNTALVVTSTNMQIFDPGDGSLEVIFDFESGAGDVSLPVSPPTGVRQIISASAVSSEDGLYIVGMTSEFVFSFKTGTFTKELTIRSLETLINKPAFPIVSVSRLGDYFMAGQILFRRDLRIIADTPEADGTASNLFIGGTGIDSNVNTIYGAFGDLGTPGGEPPSPHPTFGVLQVMDADNLYVRQRLRLPERINGRIVPGGNGRWLYAVSESGLLFLPIEDLDDLPLLEINAADRNLMYQFDFCTRNPITQTIRIESPPGAAPAAFRLSVDPFRSSGRPAILFEPHAGVTPAEILVTVDPGALGPVQGTNAIPVLIDTDAVNIPQQALVISNLRDVDQKGNFFQVPGHLIQAEADPFRDRFYVLDQRNFRVLVFDSNEMRQIGELRTGNTPTWMTISRDGRWLVVANSRAENVTRINLDTMTVNGAIFFAWELLQEGHYPISLDTDQANVIVAARTSNGGSKIDTLNLPAQLVSTRETLGIYTNQFGSDIGVAAHPDGTGVLIADSSGTVALWEALSQRLIIARRDFLSGASGAIGAGPNYWVVGSNVVNSGLVPIGTFNDGVADQESSGFALMPNGVGVRSIRPRSQVDTGALQQLDPRSPSTVINGARMAEPPPARSPGLSFSKTLAALRDGRLISTSSAGIIEFPADYHLGRGNPRITAVTNGADFGRSAGVGGLISIFGENLAPRTEGAVSTPLPNKLGGACISANGSPLPMLYSSGNQLNAQMLFTSIGPVSVQVHSQDGTSDIFVKQVDAAAPAIFGVRGPNNARFPAIFRENNTLATLSNPLRPSQAAIIYLTGLGGVSPLAVAGVPASATVLSETISTPLVEVGGVPVEVLYSGLTPGFVGLYQINVLLPSWTPLGLEVPLSITMGANSTTTNVRVVD